MISRILAAKQFQALTFLNSVDEVDDWAAADKYCSQFNNGEGRLVSIHSIKEVQYLTHALKFYGQQEGQTRKIWIGLRDPSWSGQFGWSDSSVVDFQYWSGNQPNTENGKRLVLTLKQSYK